METSGCNLISKINTIFVRFKTDLPGAVSAESRCRHRASRYLYSGRLGSASGGYPTSATSSSFVELDFGLRTGLCSF